MTTLYLPYTFSTSGSASGVWGYHPQLAQRRIDKVRRNLSSALGCKTAVCLSDSDKFVYNFRTNRYEITHSIAVACLRMNVPKVRQALLLSQPEYTTITIRALRAYLLDGSRKLKRIVSHTFTKIMSRTDVQIVCLDHKYETTDNPIEFENGSLTIDISGMWQSVECARISVLVFLDELAGLFVDTLTMEAYLHPIIAGRKRVALNSIMHDTLTNIYLPTPLIGVKDVPYRFVNTIYITGSPENVQTAKTCLEEAATRHREITKYLRIPCIPRKLDWLCTEHRDYLLKLMCDNATHITVPPRGSGDPILTLVGSHQVGINRTLRLITRVICTFYVIKIFIDQNNSTARIETRSNDLDQADTLGVEIDLPGSQSYQKDNASCAVNQQPSAFTAHNPQSSNNGHQNDPSNRNPEIQNKSSPVITFHSAHSLASHSTDNISGTSYGTPQICLSPEIKLKRISSNTFKTYYPPCCPLNGISPHANEDDVIIYNTQEMDDFIHGRNSFSTHMLIRSVNSSNNDIPSNTSPCDYPGARLDSMDYLLSSSLNSPPNSSQKSKNQVQEDISSKSITLSCKAIPELLRVSQITGAEIFHERDIITIYGNELVIKKAHKMMAQLQWLNSMHRLIVYQLELAAENREFVNGKKNGKINKIVKASGCNIAFQEPYNDYNVLIEVQATQFSKALEGLSYLENEIPAEISFYIPESYHKRIIGVSGKNIQKIMKKFAVYIKFTNAEEFESLGGYFENIDNVIARTPAKNVQNLDSLRSAVLEQLGSSYKQRVAVGLAIPQSMHRLVAGRQACNLRDVTCCCDVQVVFPYKETGSCDVYVMGTESQIALASGMFSKLIPKIHSFKIPISQDIVKSILKKFLEFTYYLSSSRGIEIYASAPSHIVSMNHELEDPELYINLIYMPPKQSEMEKVEAEILDFFSGSRTLPVIEDIVRDTNIPNVYITKTGSEASPVLTPQDDLSSRCPDALQTNSFNMYNCFDYKLLPFPASCEEEAEPPPCCVNAHVNVMNDLALPKPVQNPLVYVGNNLWSNFNCGGEYDQSTLPVIPAMPYSIHESHDQYMLRAPLTPYEKPRNNNLVPPCYMRNDNYPQTPHPVSYVYPRLGQPYTHKPFYYAVYDTSQQRKMNQPRYLCDNQDYDPAWPVQQRTPLSARSLSNFYNVNADLYPPQNVDSTIQQLVSETSELSISNNNSITASDNSLKNEFTPIANNQVSHASSQNATEDSVSPCLTSSSSMLQRLASDFFSVTPNDDVNDPSVKNVSPELRRTSTCQSFFSEETCLGNTINRDPNHSLRHTHQTPQRVGQ